MNTASLLKQQPLFVEIGQDSLQARQGGRSMEIPLQRGPDGQLVAQSKQKTIAALKDFLKPKSWLPRIPAWCAIGARGMSLRRISLPGGTKDEIHQRLLLQIEAEFPLPPDELAWGYQSLNQAHGAARQDLLVAAVKKELVADYQDIFRQCGAEPVFTLASIARWNECGQPKDSFGMLDLGSQQAEFTVFENSAPTNTRVVFWSCPNVASPADGDVESLAKSIRSNLSGSKLYVSGNGVSKVFTDRLSLSLGNGCKCQPLDAQQGAGVSIAISGLEKIAASGRELPLAIRMEPVAAPTKSETLDWKKWGVRAGILLAAALLLPYAEALLFKPHLEAKVAAFKKDAERLTVIDRELDFLQKLKLSQPPYLDVLDIFSRSAPQGTRFDSISLNSHGEVAWRCSFQDGQQVSDFRDKLIASGFFTNVVVEEQTRNPMNPQKVNVRMSGLERSPADLVAASARLAAEEAAKDKKSTNGAPATASSNLAVSRKEPQ